MERMYNNAIYTYELRVNFSILIIFPIVIIIIIIRTILIMLYNVLHTLDISTVEGTSISVELAYTHTNTSIYT